MKQQEFKNCLHTLLKMISNGIAYFSDWYTLANLTEDEAHSLNRYRGFFMPVQRSLRDMAILQVAKVFDNRKDSISLLILLSEAKRDTTLLPYTNKGDLEQIESLIENNKTIIESIRLYRHKILAHQTKEEIKISLPYGKVRQLIDDIKVMFDILSKGHERSTTSYNLLIREAENHTTDVKWIMYEERERAKIRTSLTLRKVK